MNLLSILSISIKAFAAKCGLSLWGFILTCVAFLVTFFMPIFPLLVLIAVIACMDLVTAIMRDKKRLPEKVKIQSHKLRNTSIKLSFYWLIILAMYATAKLCTNSDEIAVWIARATAFAFTSNELFSVGENMNIVTGSNIFLTAIRKGVKKLTGYINSMIADKTKNEEGK